MKEQTHKLIRDRREKKLINGTTFLSPAEVFRRKKSPRPRRSPVNPLEMTFFPSLSGFFSSGIKFNFHRRLHGERRAEAPGPTSREHKKQHRPLKHK